MPRAAITKLHNSFGFHAIGATETVQTRSAPARKRTAAV